MAEELEKRPDDFERPAYDLPSDLCAICKVVIPDGAGRYVGSKYTVCVRCNGKTLARLMAEEGEG